MVEKAIQIVADRRQREKMALLIGLSSFPFYSIWVPDL
jgi:hypothetical protein